MSNSLRAEDLVTGERIRQMVEREFTPDQVRYADSDDAERAAVAIESAPEGADPVVLVTHNGDRGLDAALLPFLGRVGTKIRAWFAQNTGFATGGGGPIFPLPIGLANSRWPHGDLVAFSRIVAQTASPQEKRTDPDAPVCFFNFSIHTNPAHRQTVRAALEKTNPHWRVQFRDATRQPQSFSRYAAQLAKYKYCVCPRGNGEDTHRLWECLYLGVVPLVERSLQTEYFVACGLPLRLVDDWNSPDLAESRLAEDYGQFVDIHVARFGGWRVPTMRDLQTWIAGAAAATARNPILFSRMDWFSDHARSASRGFGGNPPTVAAIHPKLLVLVFGCLTIPKYAAQIERLDRLWGRAAEESGIPVVYAVGEKLPMAYELPPAFAARLEELAADGRLLALPGVADDYRSASYKQNLGLHYLFSSGRFDPDFVHICGTDVFLHVRNALDLLSEMSPSRPLYIGGHGCQRVVAGIAGPLYFHSGGPGFLLSRAALQLLLPHFLTMTDEWIQLCQEHKTTMSPGLEDACDVCMAYYCHQLHVSTVVIHQRFFFCSPDQPCMSSTSKTPHGLFPPRNVRTCHHDLRTMVACHNIQTEAAMRRLADLCY